MRSVALFLLLLCSPAFSAELHYAPTENLEKIDVGQIDEAETSIDFASYVLSDWLIIDALINAGARGVKVRIYVDGGQAGMTSMSPDGPFGKLFTAVNIELKQKRPGRPIQHLKSYCVDGHVFRTGSANFSASGLKQQDNDLLLFDDVVMCTKFEANFETIWNGRDAE